LIAIEVGFSLDAMKLVKNLPGSWCSELDKQCWTSLSVVGCIITHLIGYSADNQSTRSGSDMSSVLFPS